MSIGYLNININRVRRNISSTNWRCFQRSGTGLPTLSFLCNSVMSFLRSTPISLISSCITLTTSFLFQLPAGLISPQFCGCLLFLKVAPGCQLHIWLFWPRLNRQQTTFIPSTEKLVLCSSLKSETNYPRIITVHDRLFLSCLHLLSITWGQFLIILIICDIKEHTYTSESLQCCQIEFDFLMWIIFPFGPDKMK